jgi:glycosyltransferase involved in cell wall biosynthesis
MKIPDSNGGPIFFSLVVPAYNEERYIDKTILSIKELDYPKESLEVIIVDNGSVDKTLEIIGKLSPDWFQVFVCQEQGVSKAKNKGIENISAQDGWVIFLDGDSYFEKGFLKELNEFLRRNRNTSLGCGMVSLRPWPDSRAARFWYHFYNFANRVTKSSRCIQIIRRDLLKDIRFDEALTFDEDTMLLRQCKMRSNYFFLRTRKVYSSIRRFGKNGWIGQLIQWISFASRSYEKKKAIQYQVLR